MAGLLGKKFPTPYRNDPRNPNKNLKPAH
ncbi:unnamed protein product [Aureobasidium pullulans]|nr:unnamed protein product [Aureobasidium pullulans]CAD0042367.1 unnamed protein product [Aureobasidium pullulans]